MRHIIRDCAQRIACIRSGGRVKNRPVIESLVNVGIGIVVGHVCHRLSWPLPHGTRLLSQKFQILLFDGGQ